MYDVYSAGTGRVIGEVPDMSPGEVGLAVARAESATGTWQALGTKGRAEAMDRFADAVENVADELALVDSQNGGNPYAAMRVGVRKGIEAVRYFSGIALTMTGQTIPATTDYLHYTVREPFGVVGIITAYNHPAMFALARTAAALVVGNTVVLKPSADTPLSALRIAEIADDVLGKGVLNVITGGAGAGSALVRHPRVRRIGFTGSAATALAIQMDSADSGHIKRLSFELGGKNPLIICEDSDVAFAIDGALEGMNLTRVLGQSCGSTSRVFVHESLYEAVSEGVAARMRELRIGPPEDPETELGALVSRRQLERVKSYVETGRREGAAVMTGGRQPEHLLSTGGFFYEPTLFRDVQAGMTIAREEIFGPVLAMIPWSDETAMLKAVNDSNYGLTASVFTQNLTTAHRLARLVESGYIWINGVEKRWIGVPFGGQKDSGTTTEYSVDELYNFTQNKTISVFLG